MDVNDENRAGFNTGTNVQSDVGVETQSFDQERVVEIVEYEQVKESGCSVDETMKMKEENHDGLDMPTVGEKTRIFAQALVGEIFTHDEQQGRESDHTVYAEMDMEDENRDGLDTLTVVPSDVGEEQSFVPEHVVTVKQEHDGRQGRESLCPATLTVVPSDVGKEKQCFVQEHVATVKQEHDEQQGRDSSCSADVSVHMDCSKSDEEENASLDLDMEKNDAQLAEDSETVDSEDENYLSNKYPVFNVILTKSHVKRPYELNIPDNFHPKLPHVTVPVVIRCGGKNWKMSCIMNSEKQIFCSKWRKFVNGNDLKIGDACVFELRECSEKRIKFKVILLRNDLPPELQGKIQSIGGSEQKPIELD